MAQTNRQIVLDHLPQGKLTPATFRQTESAVPTPGEGEVLSDLIVAAHADAKRKLDAAQAEAMKTIAGPLAGLGEFRDMRALAMAGRFAEATAW